MFVLDASAMLALLLREKGADFVVERLEAAEASIVNVCEVMVRAAEAGADVERTRVLIERWGVRVRAFREAHAVKNAELRPLTKHLGLGFGDRAALAQGFFSHHPVLTSDTKWSQLDLGIGIIQIR